MKNLPECCWTGRNFDRPFVNNVIFLNVSLFTCFHFGVLEVIRNVLLLSCMNFMCLVYYVRK